MNQRGQKTKSGYGARQSARQRKKLRRLILTLAIAVAAVVLSLVIAIVVINAHTTRVLEEEVNAQADTFQEGVTIEGIALNGYSREEAQKLFDMICEKAEVGAVFCDGGEEVKYCIASREKDVRPTGEALNTALEGRGGGRAEMVQGSLPCGIDRAVAVWEKITAQANG